MDNPEKLTTSGTQDTSRGQQTIENTERAIRNGQSRETGNIGYAGQQTLENTQGAIRNGQSRKTGNIGYTGHKSRTTNDRQYRTSNQKWTIQRNWQHRVHKTQVKYNKH